MPIIFSAGFPRTVADKAFIQKQRIHTQRQSLTWSEKFGDMLKNRMTDHITLAELDAVSHGLSVALFDSGGHNMYCNTEYFLRCGIIDDKGNVLIRQIPD